MIAQGKAAHGGVKAWELNEYIEVQPAAGAEQITNKREPKADACMNRKGGIRLGRVTGGRRHP